MTLLDLKRRAGLALVALGLAGLLGHFAVAQQAPAKPVVYVLKIDGVIDLGLAPFVKRVLNEATAASAAAVILEIDTFGGRVDAAVQIRDTLLDAKVRTVGFVNKRAISAGALIGLATRTLVMAPGSTLGAAAPVQTGAPGAAALPADEKTVSYVRKEFRATAEARQRPLLLAEAMVDADVAVPGDSSPRRHWRVGTRPVAGIELYVDIGTRRDRAMAGDGPRRGARGA